MNANDYDDDVNDDDRGRAEALVVELLSLVNHDSSSSSSSDDDDDDECNSVETTTAVAEERRMREAVARRRRRRTVRVRRQFRICSSLSEILRRSRDEEEEEEKEGGNDADRGTTTTTTMSSRSDDCSFIRTSMSDYNHKRRDDDDDDDCGLSGRRGSHRGAPHLREALGSLSSSSASDLAAALTGLITARRRADADAADLLEEGSSSSPGNDAAPEENEEHVSANNSAVAAMIVSPLGLEAAVLYAELLGTEGAWGAGMVDVGGIAAVSAMVRRWGAECRGREGLFLSDGGGGQAGNNRGKNGGGHEAKRSRVRGGESSGRPPPSRESARIGVFADGYDGDPRDDSPLASERGTIAGGLRLTEALARVPLSASYANWSAEARELFVEGASAALGIASALLAGVSDEDDEEDAASVVGVCRRAASSLEFALGTTVLPPEASGGGIGGGGGRSTSSSRRNFASRNNGSLAARQEDALAADERLRESGVHLLRGMLPLFRLKMELPNGQAGKLAAYETASSLVANAVASISEDIERSDDPRGPSRTPRPSSESPRESTTGRRDSGVTPKRGGRASVSFSKTPAADKKRRKSLFGPTPNLLAPPSLKKSITPRRRARRQSTTPRASSSSSDATRPALHPVLGLVVGLLHKLFTEKGLERAEARSRVCSFAVACLARLPPLEGSGLLKFVGSMCKSKVSSHRLLGVELIGEILCQGWFWKYHEKLRSGEGAECDRAETSFRGSAFEENASQAEEGAGEEKGEEGSNAAAAAPSAALLAALQGRLSDKSPTVRTRAAMSLSEAARRATAAWKEGRNLDGTVISGAAPFADPTAGGSDLLPSRALAAALCRIGPSLVETLRRRASADDRASVRRSAVAAWSRMLQLARREDEEGFRVSSADVSALCQLCNDSSVATRKAAADALTKLVQATYDDGEERAPQASSLEIAWAYTVLPLVSDAEASCVTKAVEFFSALVIEPIVELGENPEKLGEDCDRDKARYLVAWRILSKLSDGSKEAGGSRNASGSLIVALQKLLISAGKNHSKSLAKNLFRAVYHVGGTSLDLDRQQSFSMNDSSTTTEPQVNTFDPDTNRTGAFCLLASLCSCLTSDDNVTTKLSSSTANVSLSQAVRASRIDSSFLTLSLQKLRALTNSPNVPSEKKVSLTATSRDCLRVIAKMGCFIPFDDAEACFSELRNDLESFTVSIDLISASIHALIALTKRICDGNVHDDSGKKDVFVEVRGWVDGLLHRCEAAIESCFSSLAQRGSFPEQDKEVLSHVLYMVGELSMVGFASQENSSRLKGNMTKQSREDVTPPTDLEPVRGLLICPSSRLVHLVKLLLPSSMPMPSNAADEHSELIQTPSTLRAHAFVTLGKLCLRNETLAKKSLNILARELHRDSNSDPAVSSNCLMVMGDLCVRYTNLVDRYLPFMAACLNAGEGKSSVAVNNSGSRFSLSFHNRHMSNGYSLVKKNAILLLSSLLLQDYVKWRGLFIHRFLAAVADNDDEVSCLAQAALRGPLLEKQPNLLCNHFVGTVFVFNSCKAHPIYAAEASRGGNGLSVDFEGTSLAGDEGCHRRCEVYEMMLANLTDEQKLEVTARLVKDILGGALETTGDLSAVCKMSAMGVNCVNRLSSVRIEAATNVLTDTLTILTSPAIKVGRKGTDDPEDDLVNTNGPKPDQQRNAHKLRLLTKISRKHLMEIVIPILCNLKTVLEGSHSPLLRHLIKYLGNIFRSYKVEVQEHLANNPILLQELEYDTRQYDKSQKQRDMDSILQAEIVTNEAGV